MRIQRTSLHTLVVALGLGFASTLLAQDLPIIALPDTQYYSDQWRVRNYNGGHIQMFPARTNWIQQMQHQIVTNGETPATLTLPGGNGDVITIPKIAFVVQLGDITNDGDSPADPDTEPFLSCGLQQSMPWSKLQISQALRIEAGQIVQR